MDPVVNKDSTRIKNHHINAKKKNAAKKLHSL